MAPDTAQDAPGDTTPQAMRRSTDHRPAAILDPAIPLSQHLVEAIPPDVGSLGGLSLPGKLNRPIATALVHAIANGHYHATAARLVGLHPQTLAGWLAKGEEDADEPTSIYRAFKAAVDAAEAEWEDRTIRRVDAAGDQDWKAGMTLLGRRHRDRWAEQLSDAGNAGAKVVLNVGIVLPGTPANQPQLTEPQAVTVIPKLIE